MLRLSLLPLMLTIAACSSPSATPDTPTAPDVVLPGNDIEDPIDGPQTLDGTRTRSGSVVLGSDTALTFTADPDNGELLVWRRTDEALIRVPVGAEPTRLARMGDHIFVTLRGAGEVVRLLDNDATLAERHRAPVGAEPFDVVPAPLTSSIFVSLSMEDAVVQLDAATLVPIARWTIPGEPRWMAAHVDPDTGHEVVAIATMRGGAVHLLDATTGTLSSRTMPARQRFTTPGCDDRLFASRITGEVAWGLDERTLYVPVLYADTLIERSADFGDTGMSFPDDCDEQDQDHPDPGGGDGDDGAYGAPVEVMQSAATGRFNPTVVALPPSGPATVFAIAAPALPPDRRLQAVRGIVSGLEIFGSDEGERVVATMESTSTLVVFDPSRLTEEPEAAPFSTPRRGTISAGAGALSPRFSDGDAGELRVWTSLERELTTYSLFQFDHLPDREEPSPDRPGWRGMAPPSMLDAEVLAGRMMFFRTDLPQMAATGSGVSCSTCHADGRTDGFTWQFADFPRQTPSLAGPVYLTEPVTWTGEVDTVMMEAHITSATRMGGTGATITDAEQIARYVNWSRLPILPTATGAEADLVTLGREVFSRPEVGCLACHGGEQGTYGATVPMFGLPAVNVPTLRAVAATAPYFHDGSAATLRAVLERSRDGSMGDTSSLSTREMDALEAYLRHF